MSERLYGVAGPAIFVLPEGLTHPAHLPGPITLLPAAAVLGQRTPRATLTLVVTRRNGERLEVPVTCRLDTAEEVSIYEAGGVLQRFAQDFLEAHQAA